MDVANAHADQAQGHAVQEVTRPGDGDKIALDEAGEMLGMCQVNLATTEGRQASRIPIARSGVVRKGYIGTAQGRSAGTRAQAEELAGVARGSVCSPGQQQGQCKRKKTLGHGIQEASGRVVECQIGSLHHPPQRRATVRL